MSDSKVITIQSDEQFKEIINGEKPVVVDFWAPWCGPCKAISPFFEKLSSSEDVSDVVFCKVDIDKLENIAAEVGVSVVPTFMYFKGGEKVEEARGANPKAVNVLVYKAAGKDLK